MAVAPSSTEPEGFNLAPRIPKTDFIAAYQKFLHAVATHPHSDGPFESFQSGLASSWEQYKEWLYYEARRRLDVQSWRRKWIGTGRILRHVIASIEIREDRNYRNNIVQWDGRRGEDSDSHRRLHLAKTQKAKRRNAGDAIHEMYREEKPPNDCFRELAELFGARYDLLSYLFFLRDWGQFMPVETTPVALKANLRSEAGHVSAFQREIQTSAGGDQTIEHGRGVQRVAGQFAAVGR
jgi:hypothetical protein